MNIILWQYTVSLYILRPQGTLSLTSGAENDVCKDTENEEQRNGITEIKVLTYKIGNDFYNATFEE